MEKDVRERIDEIFNLINELRKIRMMKCQCTTFENKNDERGSRTVVKTENEDSIKSLLFQSANELEFLLDVISKMEVKYDYDKERCKESIKCFCLMMGIDFNEEAF